MSNNYRPRTQSKKFLDGDCPKGVLAIYDNGGATFDRYTVFYKPDGPIDFATGYIGFRGMSEHPYAPNGFGIYEELRAFEVARYRSNIYRQSAKWSELPPDVQKSVRQDCAEFHND